MNVLQSDQSLPLLLLVPLSTRSPSPAPGSQRDINAEEQARRAQRAARFNAAAALAAGTAGGEAEAPSPAALLASAVAGSAALKSGRGVSGAGAGALRRVPSSLAANMAGRMAGGGLEEGDTIGGEEDDGGLLLMREHGAQPSQG